MAYYRYRRGRYGRRRRYYRRSYKGGNRFTRKLRKSLNQKDMCRIILSSKPEIYNPKYIDFGNTPTTSPPVLNGYYTRLLTFNPMYKLMGCTNPADPQHNWVDPMAGFVRFKDLFDQFKVNAIRIRIQLVSQPTPKTYSAGLLRTAIDRNGIAPGFANQIAAQDETDASTISPCNKTLESYSSFQQKIMNATDLYTIYRTFYPIGKEKGSWFGASHMYSATSSSDFDVSDYLYPFKPILFLQFFLSSLDIAGSSCMFNVQFEYDITFKGQRNISET